MIGYCGGCMLAYVYIYIHTHMHTFRISLQGTMGVHGSRGLGLGLL